MIINQVLEEPDYALTIEARKKAKYFVEALIIENYNENSFKELDAYAERFRELKNGHVCFFVYVCCELLDLFAKYSPLRGNNVKRIVKCIEFPPEYLQAGISVLNYFGTILTNKCPEKNARVIISQDGMKVTMVIETEEGDKEYIEQTLNEYGLVINGATPINEFLNNDHHILDLKTELRIANLRIESKNDLLAYQNNNIDKLESRVEILLTIINNGISPNNNVNLNVSVQPQIETSISSNINQNVVATFDLGTSTKEIVNISRGLLQIFPPAATEVEELRAIENDFSLINMQSPPEVVKDHPALLRLLNFLNKIQEGGDKVEKTIRTAKGGLSSIQNLASHYNSIAEWCGLPQIPKLFLKNE